MKISELYGYVYLVESRGRFKIGQSKHPFKRLKSLTTGSPDSMRIVHSFRSLLYKFIEQQLHMKFASKRIRGEWFLLEPADVDYIKSLDGLGDSPDEREARETSNRQWDQGRVLREAKVVTPGEMVS